MYFIERFFCCGLKLEINHSDRFICCVYFVSAAQGRDRAAQTFGSAEAFGSGGQRGQRISAWTFGRGGILAESREDLWQRRQREGSGRAAQGSALSG